MWHADLGQAKAPGYHEVSSRVQKRSRAPIAVVLRAGLRRLQPVVERLRVAPRHLRLGRGSDPTGGAACGAAPDWDGGRPEFRRGHESRAGRRRGVMPRRRHDAARGERRGKVRGGEDVRWRACMAVWGAK